MGREQKRREQFKNKNKKLKEEELDTSINAITLLKLVGFVLILLFVVYYVLAVFVTKEIDISNGEEKSTITESTNSGSSVSNKILASNIFNQQEEEYYVYFYDFNERKLFICSFIVIICFISVYIKMYKIYTVKFLNKFLEVIHYGS